MEEDIGIYFNFFDSETHEAKQKPFLDSPKLDSFFEENPRTPLNYCFLNRECSPHRISSPTNDTYYSSPIGSQNNSEHTNEELFSHASPNYCLNSEPKLKNWGFSSPRSILKKRPYREIETEESESQYFPSSEDENNDTEDEYKPSGAKKNQTKGRKRVKTETREPEGSTKQNRMKNNQGTAAQRVKHLITSEEENGGTEFFRELTIELSEKEKQELRNFAKTINKQSKTWNALEKTFKTNLKYGLIFICMIIRFFDPKNPKYFEEWLQFGKTSDKTKKLLNDPENKYFYIEKFERMQLNLSKNSDPSEKQEFSRKKVKRT